MFIRRKIKVGRKHVEGLLMRMGHKNLIILKGSRGYIMCGYLNLNVARKCQDVAIKVTGVSSIDDVLRTKVHSCTPQARRCGIHPGQTVRSVLVIIA
jgi:uncharacterized protein YunC (DUF1805 family)